MYIVKRIPDLTEGRAAPVLHSEWVNLDEAKRFVEEQLGVMGTTFHKWTFTNGIWYGENHWYIQEPS